MQSFAIARYYVHFAPRLKRLLLVNLKILARHLLRPDLFRGSLANPHRGVGLLVDLKKSAYAALSAAILAELLPRPLRSSSPGVAPVHSPLSKVTSPLTMMA